MSLPRLLFFVPNLPRDTVSIRAIFEGREAISGSHGSFLLIADGLVRRGHQIGVVVQAGQRILDSNLRLFPDLEQGMRWSGEGGKVLWCSWGDENNLVSLRAAGSLPWMWLHTDVEPRFLRWLEQGEISGMITVSDLARLTSLHSSHYQRIGRVYNPLSPFFAPSQDQGGAAYESRQLVFSGYIGQSKGAHRVLEMWPYVRKELPDAVLVLAGSGRLYGESRPLGSLGVAAPDFEARFLHPLIGQFGSLEASGIRMTGLLSPSALRDLYSESALGLVNLNWKESTETFCCSAVEMLASSLPVFSVARGALPETIGRSGGAFLMTNPNLRTTACKVVQLLRDPERLKAAGQAGRRYVGLHYTLESILDHWECLLSGAAQELHARTGRYAFRRGPRYWAEITSGRLRIGWGLELCLASTRAICHFATQRTFWDGRLDRGQSKGT